MSAGKEEVDVVVVGAGIAGLATALALRRVGVTGVVVLERASQLRSTGAALSLFPNAWRALAALGVAHKLTPLYSPIRRGRVTNVETGASQELIFAATDKDEMGLRGVHRRVLLEALFDELPAGTVRFSSRMSCIESGGAPNGGGSAPITNLVMEDGTTISAKVVIGCDGVRSAVAKWLGLGAAVNSGRSAVRGLSVFPEGHGLSHEIQQFVARGTRLGFVPLNERELFWFMTTKTTPLDEEIAGDPKRILNHVLDAARDLPAGYLDVVRHADPSTVSWAPLLFRRPWELLLHPLHKGSVTVAGDAMHPMTPDLGQGGCSALEDAVVLGRSVGERVQAGGHFGVAAVEEYVKARRWRAAGLIAGAYVSGWVQQGGGGGWSGWVVRLVRDKLFYGLLYKRIVDSVNYDCGSLPASKVG